MAADEIKITGRLVVEVIDQTGQVRERREINNLVVTVGKGVIADRMKAVPTKTAMTHMAIGSGVTAAAAANTALGTELARVALTSTGVAANVITYVGDIPAGTGTGSVSEAGLFNAGAGGDMLARTTFAAVAKGAGDSMSITWDVTVG